MRRDGSKVFHVSEADAECSLVAKLSDWLSDLRTNERTSIAARLLQNRQVQIDGNLCQDAHRRLKTGEVVKVLPHGIAAPPTAADIKILFADEQVVVVEKPAGMTTMRHEEEAHWSARRRRREPTLEDLLPGVLAKFHGSQRSDRRHRVQTPRVLPVHRLDRETSGLMVFARTATAERSLVEQFREHAIDRAYLAIINGELGEQTIETHLARDRGDGKRGSVDDAAKGQHAVTHIRPIMALDGYTLVECQLETGRTHQIRIHLSETGHPICGDKEYRGPLGQKPILDRSGAPRLALHAARLGFEHPRSGESLLFETRLPRDLASFLKRLNRE